jgi:hypothetical protein
MGYSTYFSGAMDLDKPLTEEQKKILDEFSSKDHHGESYAPGYGCFCGWVSDSRGEAIEHDGNEKFYDYVEWLQIIVDKFIIPWGLKGNGYIDWNGDESDDHGQITIKDNVVTAQSDTEILAEANKRAKEMEEGLDKLLGLEPDKLPLLMGINPTIDAKIKDYLTSVEELKGLVKKKLNK